MVQVTLGGQCQLGDVWSKQGSGTVRLLPVLKAGCCDASEGLISSISPGIATLHPTATMGVDGLQVGLSLSFLLAQEGT